MHYGLWGIFYRCYTEKERLIREWSSQEKAPHLGICRSSSIKKTETETAKQNISKSQRAAYSLFPVGLHGENGLDPETCLHLISIYILLVLTYGLEIILPEAAGLQAFQKSIISTKNTPDPAVYILSGFIPVEGQLHMKALTFCNNICRQENTSREKRIAYHQLIVKDESSCSWLIVIRRILHKYCLPNPISLLDEPIAKTEWKRQIENVVNSY